MLVSGYKHRLSPHSSTELRERGHTHTQHRDNTHQPSHAHRTDLPTCRQHVLPMHTSKLTCRTPHSPSPTPASPNHRFVGKLSGLYPEQPVDALAVDEVMDVVQDALTRTPQDADADVKKAKREEYAAGKLRQYMALLAHRCEQSAAGGPYVLGASLTVADLALYYLLAMLRRWVSVLVMNDWPRQTWNPRALVRKKIK